MGRHLNARELRKRVIATLQEQGFRIDGGRVYPPPAADKDAIRRLHGLAVEIRIQKAASDLRPREDRLLERFARGSEVVPEAISPRLVVVESDSEDELLFRYARLHWSVPVSAGYGRRIRFLVIDESNEKLMGIIGLGDPVFSLGPRDRWVGWTREDRRQRLRLVMDAFVLGGVPPYTNLLGSKLVAMLAASNEVRQTVERKYRRKHSLIIGRKHSGKLALLTTMSALGRSSVYNRLRYDHRTLYQSVGFTQGSGEFHFSNGLYDSLIKFADHHCLPTAKHASWGTGFRNRREVIKKALPELGISAKWLYHGVEREIFVVPLASNAQQYLRGEHRRLRPFDQPASELFKWFRERWLLPRAARTTAYRDFEPSSYGLWLGRVR